MACKPTSIRIPQDVHDRLATRAAENYRSFNSELIMILKDTLEPDPLAIVVRECRSLDGVFYCAAWAGKDSDSGDDFATADSEAEVYEAVFLKIKELGPIPVEHRVEIVD